MSKRRKRVKEYQFEAFKDEFRLWQARLGLTEYEVAFTQEDHPEYATCDVDGQNCTASVTLCKYVPDGCEMSVRVAEDTAKHEALHLLLGRYRHLAHSRFTSEDELYHEEERLVRVLEGFL